MPQRQPPHIRRWAVLPALFFAASAARAGIVATGDVSPADPTIWTAGTAAILGNTSSGSVLVNGGGSVTAGATYLGLILGSSGTASVDGTGSAWSTGSLFVGAGGNGNFQVSNGGKLTTGGITYLGMNPGSSGTASVDGTGSTWSTGSLTVGESGTASLQVSNGGKLTTTGLISIGAGNAGTVTITGVGSAWSQGSALMTIGGQGAGTLNILNGATATGGGAILAQGNSASAIDGSVTIDGIGSTWTLSGVLAVGQTGMGALLVSNGGKLVNDDLLIGPGSVATLNVGDGSFMTGPNASPIAINNQPNGVFRLNAVPGLAAGTYKPLNTFALRACK